MGVVKTVARYIGIATAAATQLILLGRHTTCHIGYGKCVRRGAAVIVRERRRSGRLFAFIFVFLLRILVLIIVDDDYFAVVLAVHVAGDVHRVHG